MINKIKVIGLFVLAVTGFASCKTYYIPVSSFKAQFSGIDSTRLRLVNTREPLGNVIKYLANPIDYIKVVDKNGNPYELKNSPSIEIRFTEQNKKRTTFYFDRVFLQDSLVIGDLSRFIRYRRAVLINNVDLIEIQDGGKKFKYLEK